MQESIQLVIDSFAVPAERGWVYAATQYRRHVFWLITRVYSRADAPVANLARALAGAFLYLYFSWYATHRTTVYDLLRPAAVYIELDPIPSAMIGLSLNTALCCRNAARRHFFIDKGQWEAAASIGMTPWQTMRRAILPQAARVALPPLEQLYQPSKDTSLAATIQPELFRQAQLITSRTLEVFTMCIWRLRSSTDYGDSVIDVAEPF